jgi:hypothetical protein
MNQPTYGQNDIYTNMEAAVASLVNQGLPEDEAINLMISTLHDSLESSADRYLKRTAEQITQLLEIERDNSQRFDQMLRDQWEDAFNAFYVAAYAIAEYAEHFNRRQEQYTDLHNALFRLHERSRRVTLEVYRLLTGGFPGGAHARNRTLHELTAVALVIAKYGTEPDFLDLPKRYLDHTVLNDLKQAKFLTQEHLDFGLDVPEELNTKVTLLTALWQKLKREHGPEFSKSNGWAAPLGRLLPAHMLRQGIPVIAGINKLAGLGDIREDYADMSAEIHAGPDGLLANLDPTVDDGTSLVGPVKVGLAVAGGRTLFYLLQTTHALLTAVPEDQYIPVDDVFSLKVMTGLVAKYDEVASAIEQTIENRD